MRRLIRHVLVAGATARAGDGRGLAARSRSRPSPSSSLFAVADLSTAWVIGDLYEKDFATVRVGSEATVGVPACSPVALRGTATQPRGSRRRVGLLKPRFWSGGARRARYT